MSTSSTTETKATRFDVNTEKGTNIAVWTLGNGPALVMVHGSMADHTTFDSLISALAQDTTIFAMDRRGFGASPDTPGHSIEQDFADVARVVDAVAARTGGPVSLWGHSYGANCAMGGAALTGNVCHLILYEPSLGLPYPPGSIEAIEDALAKGDNDAAITAVMVDILELTDGEIDAFRASTLWPIRLAAAPTIPRECRAEQDWVYRPGQFDAITAPTLLLTGSDSVPVVTQATDLAAAAIPDARIHLAPQSRPVASRLPAENTLIQLLQPVFSDPGRFRTTDGPRSAREAPTNWGSPHQFTAARHGTRRSPVRDVRDEFADPDRSVRRSSTLAGGPRRCARPVAVRPARRIS